MNGEQLSQHVTIERKNKLNKWKSETGASVHVRSGLSEKLSDCEETYTLYLHPLLCDSLSQLVRVSLPQASVRERLVTDYESAQNHTEKVIPTHTHPS